MYAVSFIYFNLSLHGFFLNPFKATYFSPKIMTFFHWYHRQRLTFPSILLISLSPRSLTCHPDRCYHQKFNPKTLYFHHLAGDRVVVVHEDVSLNENAIQTTIHHRSIVPRGHLARGSVSKMLRYIYATPPNGTISGDAKQILPLTGVSSVCFGTRMLYPVWLCSCHPCNLTLILLLYH